MCLISLPAYLVLFGEKEKPSVLLKTLIQKTPTSQALSARFFSDYLGLSPGGRFQILQKLDLSKIQKKLEEFPIFKHVHAEFTPIGELLVSYELRKPVLALKDYAQLGVDAEGMIVPIAPYYSPKRLPEVYLGLKTIEWNRAQQVNQALDIMAYFDHHALETFTLKLIDLSRLTHSIPSHREIIVTISIFNKNHYLRLNPQHVDRALHRYMRLFKEAKLKNQLHESIIFDARITKFATLKVCA